MAEDVLETVRSRNDFYRDNYRRVMSALLLMVIIVGILTVILAYLVVNKPAPRYFAVNPDGSLIRMIPLDRPNQPDSYITQWSSMVATATYGYNFLNYRQELVTASEFFTPDGWSAFQAQLVSTGTVKEVIQNKYNVSAVPTGAPVVIRKGVVGRTYTWTVQMPMLVTYENVSGKTNFNYTVTMTIVRVPTTQQPRGVAVAQFSVT